MLRRYHLQDREDYKAYNKLCGMVTKLTHLLQQLDPADEERIQMTDELLDKCAPTLQIASSSSAGFLRSAVW